MAGRSARAPLRRDREQSVPHTTFCNRKSCTMEYLVTTAVSALALILYWNTLNADFAYDDSRAIKTNQDLLPSTPITNLFHNDFWGTPLTHSGSHKSYRPLCVLSFRLNYAVAGFDPWGYHLFNVLLHLAVSVLFARLAGKLFLGTTLPSLVAGMLFAAHPIHTEAVAGVVGRADVGACLFFLLSLLSYITYCKYRDKKYHLYLSLLFAAASMLTKEHGVTVLVVCVIYDVFIQHKISPKELGTVIFEKRFRSLREGLVHLTGAAITLLAMRFHLMGSKPPDFAPADNPASDSDSFLTRTLTFFYLPAFNFWLLLCPRWLSFDWSMESIPLLTSPLDPRNLLSACFYGGFFHILVHLYRILNRKGSETSAFSATTHLCGCVPSYWSQKLNFPACQPLGGKTRKQYVCVLNNNNPSCSPFANGHRLINGACHVTSNGNCMPSPSSLSSSSSSSSTSSLYHESNSLHCSYFSAQVDIIVIAVSLMVFPFIPATNLFFYVGFVVAERVLYIPSMGFCLLVALGVDQMYRRQDSLLKKRLLLAVTFGLIMVMSVRTVLRNRDWWHEENLYRSGIPINPPKAYGNLANILSAQGKKSEAEWAYRKALSYRSNMADVHYNLGILLQEQGRYDEALQSYKLAIKFRPRLAMAHLNLGLVLGILGRKEEAAEAYRHCSQLDSSGLKDPKMHETTKISALFNLGRLYADDGSYEEAIQIYQEAVQKMPEHYQPQSLYNMMGEAFFKLKQYQEAEHWYHEALKAKPDHIPAHLTYAKLLSKWSRQAEAEKWFLKAKSLAPNDSSVYQHYGQFLSENERHSEAAEVYIRAAELAPEEYEIIFNAANTLRQAGRNAEAEMYYQMAVKLRPNEVTSHMNLGAMLHVNGKLLEAESSYLEALRLKPDDPITRNNLQKLRNLLAQKGVRGPRMQSRR